MGQKSTLKPSTSRLMDADSIDRLNRMMGRFSPERCAELDRLAEQQRRENLSLLSADLRRKSNVFPKYAGAEISNTVLPAMVLKAEEMTRYRNVVNRLVELVDKPTTMILRGDNGPGKTHLASSLVNLFCDKGLEAYYCRAMDFFVQVKSTFGSPGKTVDELERRFRRYKLLVIDEIEVRSESQWENNLLRSLVDARYASGVATVIITNKSETQIREYFSPAILDRISEGGAIVNCDWPSLRNLKVKA